GQQLPPLPAISATLADQSGGLPRAAAHGDVDTIDGRRPRPRDTTHNQFSCGHRRASGRLCDQRPDLLQTHGLASDAAVALPFVYVPVRLIEALEWLADRLDVGEPLHRRHRVPAGNYQPDRAAVLEWQRFTVHSV